MVSHMFADFGADVIKIENFIKNSIRISKKNK